MCLLYSTAYVCGLFFSGGSHQEGQGCTKHTHGTAWQQGGPDVSGLQADAGQGLRKAGRVKHQAAPLQRGLHLPAVTSQVRERHLMALKLVYAVKHLVIILDERKYYWYLMVQ